MVVIDGGGASLRVRRRCYLHRGIGAQMTPAANGTDERLDAVLEELRAIRRALEPTVVHVDHVADATKAKRKRGGNQVVVDVTSHSDGKPIYVNAAGQIIDPADVIE